MISDKAILCHFKNLFGRKVIKKCDKDCGIRYIDNYLADTTPSVNIVELLNTIKSLLMRGAIRWKYKHRIIERLKPEIYLINKRSQYVGECNTKN